MTRIRTTATTGSTVPAVVARVAPVAPPLTRNVFTDVYTDSDLLEIVTTPTGKKISLVGSLEASLVSAAAVGEAAAQPRANVPDANATLTYAGGRKRTQTRTADRILDIVDAGFSNGDTIELHLLDRSQFLTHVRDPAGVVIYSGSGGSEVTFERDAGAWARKGAVTRQSGDRRITLDPRAGTNLYTTGQAAIDHAALQAALDASGGDSVVDAGTLELPRAVFFVHKRLVYKGNFGTGLRVTGSVRTIASTRGTCFLWQGFIGDDDAFKTSHASVAAERNYPADGALNGAIGTGTIQGGPPAGVTSWAGTVADERFGVMTLIGPDASMPNGSFAYFDGIDDQGNAFPGLGTPCYVFFDSQLPGFLHTPVVVTATDYGTNTFTSVGHGYAAGTHVRFFNAGGDAAIPAGLFHHPTYRVLAAGLTADEFRVETLSAVAVDISAPVSPDAISGTLYVGRHARAFRTTERLRSCSGIQTPVMGGTDLLVRLGFDGGTVLDLAGANGAFLEHLTIEASGPSTVTDVPGATCLALRYDLERAIGSSSNGFDNVVCYGYKGPGASGVALGQTPDGVQSYQVDTTSFYGLWCTPAVGSSADETGVRFLESGNCLTASFYECNFDGGSAWGIDCRQGNGNILVAGCRFGSVRYGLAINGGQMQMICCSNEQVNFGAYYYYSTSAVSSVEIEGGDFRGRAPKSDDIMIMSYGTVNHHDAYIMNFRTTTSWARYAVAAPSMIIANLSSRLSLENIWINKYQGYCTTTINKLVVSVNDAGDYLNPQDLATLGENGISITNCYGGIGGALIQLPDIRGSLPSFPTYGLYYPQIGTGITRERVGMPAGGFIDRTKFTFGALNTFGYLGTYGANVLGVRVGLVAKETRLRYVYARIGALFTEGAGALTLQMGTTATAGAPGTSSNDLILATDVKAGTVPFLIGDVVGDLGATLTGAGFVQGGVVLSMTGNTEIWLFINGVVSALTAGEATIIICTEPMRELF